MDGCSDNFKRLQVGFLIVGEILIETCVGSVPIITLILICSSEVCLVRSLVNCILIVKFE